MFEVFIESMIFDALLTARSLFPLPPAPQFSALSLSPASLFTSFWTSHSHFVISANICTTFVVCLCVEQTDRSFYSIAIYKYIWHIYINIYVYI